MMEKNLTFLFSCNGKKPKQGSVMEKGTLTWVGMMVFFFGFILCFIPNLGILKITLIVTMNNKLDMLKGMGLQGCHRGRVNPSATFILTIVKN
jgi:hypothetical protein